MLDNLILSHLGHTWIFDIDGTIAKHNGYKIDGYDTLLPGVKQFFNEKIQKDDYVLLLTSRKEEFRQQTIDFLKNNDIKYNYIIFDIPYGERIVVNDKKPSGLEMSKSVNLNRNEFDISLEINDLL